MKKVVALAGIVVLCSMVSLAHAGGDVVDLVDGTSLVGRVTQQAPGSFVVIQTDDGRVQSVPWSQVKRVSASLAPLPAPASTSPQPVVPAAPPAAPGPIVVGSTASAASAVPADADVSSSAAPKHIEARFEAGVRLGYAATGGSYTQGYAIGSAASDAAIGGTKGGFPLVVDLGARLNKYVFIGGFAQYAFLATSCLTPNPGYSVSCSGHDVRGGVEFLVHTRPRTGVDPWVGLGLGHEWLTADTKVGGSGVSATQHATFDGWDYLDLMAGIDFRTSSGMGIGPYVEVASGSFDTLNASTAGGGSGSSSSGGISSQASHQWLTLGVHGTFEVQ